MLIVSGPLRVTIKYTEARANTVIFQRGIRLSVRDRYGGQKKIALDLKTKDPAKVARLVAHLNAQLEAEWDALEQDPRRSPRPVRLSAVSGSREGAELAPAGRRLAPADAFLARWGLRPAPHENDPMALQLLHDHFDSKREAFAATCPRALSEHAYREAHPTDYLDAVEAAAWRRLYVPPPVTVMEILRVYLDTDSKQGTRAAKFQRDARACFRDLTAIVGDKAVSDVARADAHAFVRGRLDAGDSTATVRRKINTLGAAWKRYRLEQDPAAGNPFESLPVPNERQDKAPRVPFTAPQLDVLYAACRAADDPLRWMFALMIDTGARVAEVVGLGIDDLDLAGPVPHMVIRDRPWRRLKTPGSARLVPLVGASLWAAERVLERAAGMAGTDGAIYAFPRYIKPDADGLPWCDANTAGAASRGWVKRLLGRGVNHELRHTLKDRLRAVQCPKAINDAITGHTSQDVGDSYGLGYTLEVKREWLLKVALG